MAIKVSNSTIIDNSRNVIEANSVAIGTNTTDAKLEVNVGAGVTALDIQGSEGQLFSVTNNLTSGSIFSVNDVSGIPSIDVNADGTILLAEFDGDVGIGTDNPTSKLDVNGTVTAITFESTQSTGTAPFTVASTTVVSNLNSDLLDGQQGSYYTDASNISSGTIDDARLPASISSDITGNADTATTSTNVTVADESTDTTCFPLFVTAATGNLPPKSGTNLKFNSNTGILDATQFKSNFNTGTGGAGQSLTEGAIVLNHTAGAIVIDNAGQKRISWNDGGGNFQIRSGHHFDSTDSREEYVVTGDGAANVQLNTDSANGQIRLEVANTGTAGTAITWNKAVELTPTSFNVDGNEVLDAATSFGGDVSGTYNAISVTNDSHTHDTRYFTETESDARFLRKDAADTHSATGGLTFNDGLLIDGGPGTIGGSTFDNGWLRIGTSTLGITMDNNELYFAGAGIIGALSGGSISFTARPAFNGGTSGSTSPFTVDSTQVVTNLNADLLDGIDSGSFVRTILTDDDITSRMNSGFYESSTATTAEGWPVTSNGWYHLISSTHSNTSNYYSMQIAGDFFSQDNFYIRSTNNIGTTAWSEIWTSSSDGSGSGLDADKLDGIEAANFLRSDQSDTMNGILTVGGTFVSGGEGGEIQLTYSPNTTLTGSTVKIDLQTNNFRIFEDGGNNRGAFLDLPNCENSVGSEILHSGSTAQTKSGNLTLDGTETIVNTTSSSDYFRVRHRTDTDIYMDFYCEENTAQIADTFAGNTDKKYIYFSNPNSSNDPGFIMHETKGSEANEGVLHLVPSDDNAEGDYVSIHGTNDADVLKLHTSGLIETATGFTLNLKSAGGDGVQINGNRVYHDGYHPDADNVKLADSSSSLAKVLLVANTAVNGDYIEPLIGNSSGGGDNLYFNIGTGELTISSNLLFASNFNIKTGVTSPTGTGSTNFYGETITGTNSTVTLIEEANPLAGGLVFKTNNGGGAGSVQFYDTDWRPKLKIRSGGNNGIEVYNGESGMVMKTIDSPGIGVTIFGNLYVGTGNSSLTPPENSIGGGLYVGGALYDGGNGAGTSGQVLSSTGTGVDWIDQSSVTASFDGLTGKTSGTGEYSTTGYLVSGRGTGGVALTVNDGYGNANVTFNHKDGTPEQTGKAGRIEVNTDATTGDATMSFELGDATAATAAAITQVLELSSGTSTWASTVTFNGLVNFRGNVDLADDDILRFGSGDDCEMFCNGSNQFLDLNSALTNFNIRNGTTTRFQFNKTGQLTISSAAGTNAQLSLNNGNTGSAFVLRQENNANVITSSAGIAMRIGPSNQNNLDLRTNDNVRMRIEGDGDILVGQTNTATPGNGNTTDGSSFRQSGRNYMSASSNAPLQCNRTGTDGVLINCRKGGTSEGNVSVNNSGTQFNTTSSDSRLKKNFEDWSSSVLPAFRSLNPQKFHFIRQDDSEDKTKGFIAQELVGHFPEAYPLLMIDNPDTGGDEEIERYMFNPSGMVTYLMKGLQEALAEIDALKARLDAAGL